MKIKCVIFNALLQNGSDSFARTMLIQTLITVINLYGFKTAIQIHNIGVFCFVLFLATMNLAHKRNYKQ